MVELQLIRHGQKTDFDLKQKYDVVERATWLPTPYPQYGVSLAQWGYDGLWKLAGIEEPLAWTFGVPPPIDYYTLPPAEGVTVYDQPHPEDAPELQPEES